MKLFEFNKYFPDETAYRRAFKETRDEVDVDENGNVVGDFHADAGGQTSISIDISSALRAIWSDYDFTREVAAARGRIAFSSRHG